MRVGKCIVVAVVIPAVQACCTAPGVTVSTLGLPSELPACLLNSDLQCCQQVRFVDPVTLHV